MNITDYSDWTDEVWIDNGPYPNITHCLYGMQTETAELTDIHKKEDFTPGRSAVRSYDRAHVVEEIGDVLFYLVRYAREMDISMMEVIDANVNKLNERYNNDS